MYQTLRRPTSAQHSTEFGYLLKFLFVMFNICFISVYCSTAVAQEPLVSIQGTVIDENDEPLIGVTIFDKSSQRSAVTNLDGRFSLLLKSMNTTLVVSFIGYASQTIAPQSILKIKLVPSNQNLDEVVVVGFGTVKKRDLTGAVTSIKATDITLLPTSNALESLQGKVPGMDIVRSSGKAGSGVNITIRGNRSINGNNAPLFVIDGIQGGSYSDINPNDIESAEILKDASSTAIYGSEGANGVVIITTKKGKTGKPQISYDGYYGINKPEYPKTMTGNEWMNFIRESKRTVGKWSAETAEVDDPVIFGNDIWTAIQNKEWVDWVDLVLQDGYQQSHTVSVNGGSDQTKAFLSLSMFDEEGLLKNDRMKRYSFRTNIDHKINDVLSIGLNTQLIHRINNNRKSSIITTCATAIPFGTPYDEFGAVNRYPITGSTTLSPLLDETTDYTSVDQTTTNSSNIKAYLELRPLKGLIFRSNLAANFGDWRNGRFFDSWSQARLGATNMASVSNGISESYGWDNILTFTKEIGDHTIGATALTSWGNGISENYSMTGYDQSVPVQLFYALGSTSSTGRDIGSSYSETERLAFGGRLNYSYKGKYLFQATDRYEASSVLAIGHQWHHFPSISGAWRIGDESFMDDLRATVSNMKIRLSYGMTGNSGAGAYATQSVVYPGRSLSFGDNAANYYYFGALIANKQLGWERTSSYNLGLDLGLFNWVSMSVEAYQTNTTDILLKRLMPPSGGGEGYQMWQNVGTSLNKGLELSLQTMNVNKKEFKWNTDLMLSFNHEEITGLIDGKDILSGSEKGSLLLGHEITTYRCYEKLGIWQLGEEDAAAAYGLVPGDIKIKDQLTEDTNDDGINDASDGTIDGKDYVYLGSPSPKLLASFGNTFQYKNFDLSIFMYARMGQLIQHEILGRYNPSGGNHPAYFDYWTPENPSNDYPRPQEGKALIDNIGYMALTYIDGSYIKVKTISMGYSLPKSILKACKLEKARIYATVTNPFIFCTSHLIQNYDPERGGSETEPIGKTIVLGTNFSF